MFPLHIPFLPRYEKLYAILVSTQVPRPESFGTPELKVRRTKNDVTRLSTLAMDATVNSEPQMSDTIWIGYQDYRSIGEFNKLFFKTT